jgi:hypothetical protein
MRRCCGEKCRFIPEITVAVVVSVMGNQFCDLVSGEVVETQSEHNIVI